MHPRILKGEIENIKQMDGSQESDISELKAAVGEVPAEGDSLQEQITALEARVAALEDAE